MDIRYLGGSGFLVSLGTTGLLFDASDLGEFPGTLPTGQQLASFSRLYVFISQTDEGHYAPRLKDLVSSRAEFILSSDFPEEAGHRLAAGETLTLDGLKVTAYDSTDQGVAFLVETAGVKIFHAGSLNLWHWRDISTISEIEAAEKDFNTCLSAIPKNVIDVAFFPVDPRQGSMFDAGAGAFLMTAKPKLLIPMHFQDRADAAHYFASTNETNSTRISVLEKADDHLEISFPEECDPNDPILPQLPEPDSSSVSSVPCEAEDGVWGPGPQAGTGGSPSSPTPAEQASSSAAGSDASDSLFHSPQGGEQSDSARADSSFSSPQGGEPSDSARADSLFNSSQGGEPSDSARADSPFSSPADCQEAPRSDSLSE